MRTIPAYILLIVYSFAQLKPAATLLQDVFAHVFYKAQHLATVHVEDGKFHIHKELQKAAKESESSGATNNKKTSDTCDDLYSKETSGHNKLQRFCEVIDPAVAFKMLSLQEKFIPIDLPPPRPAFAENKTA